MFLYFQVVLLDGMHDSVTLENIPGPTFPLPKLCFDSWFGNPLY